MQKYNWSTNKCSSRFNSVFLKFKKKCNGRINPKIVNKLSTPSLKGCGLSKQKVKGIKELAKKTLSKNLIQI